ncbi:hypothetical protein SERLA73DRAFT_77645 [Serpula lacrymans var. lacrymans S7.3]|uniref:Uncharacterized protein n=1 Tax=Serpula lacrymans var. lacrymans (strain S7.3) TaxID=936435 RepID=F8QA07_SERL3|nr:hypothetical protein SERLA73DRAFT_77645 [Serpula lacrymans var. lacrymans S7.3]
MYTPSSSSQPRPILKRSQCAPPAHHRSLSADKLVHFPPSPTLTRTFSAHSSTAYDRSPIVVTPNSCALPERGCPGRTYTLEEERSSSPILMKKKVSNNGIHLHPRAVPPQQDPYVRPSHLHYHQNNADDDFERSPRSSSSLPPLIPDLSSSESDESDGFISPPPEAYHPSLVPAPSIPKPRSRGASIMSSVASMSEQGTPSTPTPLSFFAPPSLARRCSQISSSQAAGSVTRT